MAFPDPGHMIAKVIASETIQHNPRFADPLENRLKWTSPDDPRSIWANRGFDSLTVHCVDNERLTSGRPRRP
jgi:hypothetical protein